MSSPPEIDVIKCEGLDLDDKNDKASADVLADDSSSSSSVQATLLSGGKHGSSSQPREIYKPSNAADAKSHQEYMLMLSRYNNSRFAEYLRKLSFKLGNNHLKTCSVDELQELLARVRVAVNSKSSTNLFSTAVYSGLSTVELLSMRYTDKIKLRGLTESLKQNDEFSELLDIIQLEWQSLTMAPPHVRLVYCVVVSAIKCHQVNSFLEKRGAMMKERMAQADDEKNGSEQQTTLTPLSPNK